jgi:hypothetical protein
MASLIYKNHRIIISAAPHRYTNRYTWSVVVSWSENDRPTLRPIKNWFQQFDSKQDAEVGAIEAAKLGSINVSSLILRCRDRNDDLSFQLIA